MNQVKSGFVNEINAFQNDLTQHENLSSSAFKY